MNDIANKWNSTRLLDNLNDIQKDECAQILENVAQLLVKHGPEHSADKKEWEKFEELCEFILPITRALYNELYSKKKKFPDAEWLLEDFKKYFVKNKPLFDDLKKASYTIMEAESEFEWLYRKDCVKRL